MLVTARACQGGFAAVMAPSALSILTNTFTEERDRGKAFAVFGAIAGAGASVGLLLGGVLTEYLSWRWTLYVNLLFAGAALISAAVLLTREPARGDDRSPAMAGDGQAVHGERLQGVPYDAGPDALQALSL
jgi:MFS family permease